MITNRRKVEQSIEERARQLEDMRARHHETCPVCGKTVPGGLSIAFYVCEEGAVETRMMFTREQEGYLGHVHGGLIASVLDGAMTNCLFSYGIAAVTGEMTLRMSHPVPSGEPILARARLEKSAGPLHLLSAELCADDRVLARANAKFVSKNYRSKR